MLGWNRWAIYLGLFLKHFLPIWCCLLLTCFHLTFKHWSFSLLACSPSLLASLLAWRMMDLAYQIILTEDNTPKLLSQLLYYSFNEDNHAASGLQIHFSSQCSIGVISQYFCSDSLVSSVGLFLVVVLWLLSLENSFVRCLKTYILYIVVRFSSLPRLLIVTVSCVKILTAYPDIHISLC